jgi:hypothetical protein
MISQFLKSTPLISLGLTATFAFSACEQPMTTGQKALAGAAAGAALGALVTHRAGGALVGAGMGAATGALIGHEQTEERRAYGGGFPYGRPTDREGFVFSPYYGHNIIDVRGIPPGARVVDPSCDRVFINP